ncbi:hypothetical protein Aduo_018699 [Ancylostoma duodenale]
MICLAEKTDGRHHFIAAVCEGGVQPCDVVEDRRARNNLKGGQGRIASWCGSTRGPVRRELSVEEAQPAQSNSPVECIDKNHDQMDVELGRTDDRHSTTL